ncbi:regulator of chromosome condensation (RCC1)-like protein [Achlya hypogyna]|uniref:Regulator of chromosome condensation (RCC1)-like protein n=1 Tax=Achlya hypogyna TaxID=1202772 RepID=A0A1V9Z310_ACHHY|nr:regulator of chromosome condensation (RCC1)-like protein [Achlya hypogyna]
MKRTRVDGHLSKEEYAQAAPDVEGDHALASEDILRSRRLLSARSTERKRHTYALNQSFYQGIKLQHAQNLSGSWLDNMKEYVAYVREVEARFGDNCGAVMAFGSGDCGQLGHGVDEDDDMIVSVPRVVSALAKQQIVRVGCGGLHTAAVTKDGNVYTWGCNDDGALGRTGDENFPGLVTGFPANTSIINVIGGDCHSVALAVDGSVFMWGSYKDKEGKLWCDAPTPKETFKNKQLTPYRVSGLANVADIACGSSFNVARTADGHVYSWGLGEMGQLGRPVSDKIRDAAGEYDLPLVFSQHLTPALVLLNGKMLLCKAIGCGSYHALFVASDSGGVYTTGLNNYGQLGLGHDANQVELQLVEALSHKVGQAVEGGTHSSLVLMADGTMYAFGRADSGQLGTIDNPETGAMKESPQEIVVKAKGTRVLFDQIASGSNHALAVSTKNEIYAWGYGDMCALGTGDDKDEYKPRLVDWAKTKFGAARILQVAAGGQHSAVLAQKED